MPTLSASVVLKVTLAYYPPLALPPFVPLRKTDYHADGTMSHFTELFQVPVENESSSYIIRHQKILSENADYQVIIDCADNIECTCCTEFPIVNGSYDGRPQPCPST